MVPIDEQISAKALELLVRREHARAELAMKLRQRGFVQDDIDPVLDRLVEQDLLSDTRFTELYIRHRRGAGFGPFRIEAELAERGISANLVNTWLERDDSHWCERAMLLLEKKFGRAVQSRHPPKMEKMLYDRGFGTDLARSCVRNFLESMMGSGS